MDGNPLEGYPRTSVLQSLQAALDRFRTSLEGLPGFVGIPEDAFDAETILAADSEAPIPDDGTPFVPQSVVEALVSLLPIMFAVCPHVSLMLTEGCTCCICALIIVGGRFD